MPFINVKTNAAICEEKRTNLEKALGKAIELIPGKTEAWLMLAFEGETPMSFKGNEDPCAMVEIKIFGSTTKEAYAAMTKETTEILAKELGVPADRIYVKYEESHLWGWNGKNF